MNFLMIFEFFVSLFCGNGDSLEKAKNTEVSENSKKNY